MRIHLHAIGCRLNTAEIDSLARQFIALGHSIVPAGSDADIVIFNSCAVTSSAGSESRKLIRKLRRANPYATLVITGCYAEIDIQIARDVGADMLVGTQYKDDIPQILTESGLLHDCDHIATDIAYSSSSSGRTRAFLKVQDGCENKCTFCVVTIARGAGRSKKLAQVIQEINDLVGFGYCEVVLCGVHLGAYGHDIGVNVSLEDLVLSVLKETDVKRLRLSSLEPWDLTPDFFKLWEDSRLLPHLHLPLQSGSNRTLRRMGRRNTSNSFKNLLEAARMTIPNLSVTTDVIVGFPGETDTDFIESYEFIDSMKFAGLHIFPYSGRPGTAASKMSEQISVDIIRKRSRLMHEINKKHQSQFISSFVGRELDVLWESCKSDNDLVCWSGLTSNYLRAYAYSDSDNSLRNVITKTKMMETFRGGLLGHV